MWGKSPKWYTNKLLLTSKPFSTGGKTPPPPKKKKKKESKLNLKPKCCSQPKSTYINRPI